MPDNMISFFPALMHFLIYFAPFMLIAFIVMNSIVVVNGAQIAVLERRWFGRKIPEGRVVAMANEVGIQARTLGPGLYFLIPFLYLVRKSPLTIIGENEVGLIDSIDGEPVKTGRIFAKAFKEHNLFQDGEALGQNAKFAPGFVVANHEEAQKLS